MFIWLLLAEPETCGDGRSWQWGTWQHAAPPAASSPSCFTTSSQRNAQKHAPKTPTQKKTQPPVLRCNALPSCFDRRYGLGGGGGGIPEGRVAGAAPVSPQAAATRFLQRGQEGRPGGRWPQGGSPQRGGRAAAEAEGGGGPKAALLPAAAGG